MSDKKEINPDVGLVLYTDGGCKPSRGIGGWGVHGYSYSIEPLKKPNRKTDATSNFGYIDTVGVGSIVNADQVWRIERKEGPDVTCHQVINYYDGLGSLIPESTNNIAEITAASKALSIIEEVRPKQACLLLDSDYVRIGLTEWVTTWEARNWLKADGTPVHNADLWKDLVAQYRDVKSYVDLSCLYVRGHSDDLGNDRADNLATRAIIAGRKGIEVEEITVSQATGYDKYQNNINRLFAYPRWYFVCNTHTDNATSTNHFAYHLGTNVKEDDIDGKAATDTSFAVLYVKEPEVVLDKVREFHNETTQHGYTNVVKVSLDVAFNPYNYDDVLLNGCRYMERKGSAVLDSHERVVTLERNTPHLVFRTLGVFGHLEQLLEDFISGTHKLAGAKDITDLFYEKVTVKNKETVQLSKDFKQSTKFRDALVSCILGEVATDFKVRLTVGLDIPNRNTLVALAAKEPEVYLLHTVEGSNSIRIHVVIKSGDDYSIWSSVYSNLYINLDLR